MKILILICVVALAALVADRQVTTAGAQSATAEVRALWVDAFHDGIKTGPQVQQLVNDARRANINTLIVQVRRRGDLYYPGPEPAAADLQPGFDALKAVLKAAHEGSPRLEVQAWLPALPIWSDRQNPPPWPEHLMYTHGPSAPGAQNWIMWRDDGEVWGDGVRLDPGNPEAAAYLVDLTADLVRRYDVDGVHLDHIRYFEGDAVPGGARDRRWGYNPVSVARFNEANGRLGWPDPNDSLWMSWRRDQVTELVRRIRDELSTIRPELKLSVAAIPWGAGPLTDADWERSAAYTHVFQDWRGWLQRGLIDQAFVMNYNRESSTQEAGWLDRWLGFERQHTYGRQVIAGLAAYLNSPADTIRQIKRAESPGSEGTRLAGVALYSYATPDASRSNQDPADDLPGGTLWETLTQPGPDNDFAPPFAEPAALPPMPWKVR